MSKTELTRLTLAEARDGLRRKDFTSVELTIAFNTAIEAGNGALNAYVLPTPDLALRQAKASDQRIALGKAGALEGLPLGIKDLYCTKGVRTTACTWARVGTPRGPNASRRLAEFRPEARTV